MSYTAAAYCIVHHFRLRDIRRKKVKMTLAECIVIHIVYTISISFLSYLRVSVELLHRSLSLRTAIILY